MFECNLIAQIYFDNNFYICYLPLHISTHFSDKTYLLIIFTDKVSFVWSKCTYFINHIQSKLCISYNYRPKKKQKWIIFNASIEI